jgi:hypothetical protein
MGMGRTAASPALCRIIVLNIYAVKHIVGQSDY